MRTMLVDHSNRIAREVGSEGGYTQDEIDAMAMNRHDAYQFRLQCLYNEGVVDLCRWVVGDSI